MAMVSSHPRPHSEQCQPGPCPGSLKRTAFILPYHFSSQLRARRSADAGERVLAFGESKGRPRRALRRLASPHEQPHSEQCHFTGVSFTQRVNAGKTADVRRDAPGAGEGASALGDKKSVRNGMQ